MSNTKLFLLVGGLIAGLCLLILLFVGAIAGTILYSIGHSAAALTAENFLRHNETLKQDIGEVRDFGWFVGGRINAQGSDGVAALSLKAIGTRRSAWTTVQLSYRNGGDWRVVGAWYVNAEGRTISLFDPYGGESADRNHEPTRIPQPNQFVQQTNDETFDADVLQAERPVLIEFTATLSDEGTRLAPVFDETCAKYAQRIACAQMRIEHNPATYQRYNVVALPTLILFQHGQEQDRLVGMRSTDELSRMIEQHLRHR
jgi:thioredoxin 1